MKFCDARCCISLAGVLKNHITCQGKGRKEGKKERGKVRRRKGGREGRTEGWRKRKDLPNCVKPCVSKPT